MKINELQQSIINSLNKTEFIATRALSKTLNLSPPCVRNNVHKLSDAGLIESSMIDGRLMARAIEKPKIKPNFDKLLFSTKWS